MAEVAEPLCCHHIVAMLTVLERTVRFCTSTYFATPLWCRILPDISRSEFVVPSVRLDQMIKLAITSGGKRSSQTMGWGAAGSGDGRAVLGCAGRTGGTDK